MNIRRRFMIVSLALVLLLGTGTGALLYGQDAYEPPEPSHGVDLQRSQVYLSGTGYEIDKQQEKTHKKEEKEKEEQQKEDIKNSNENKSRVSGESASVKKVRERSTKKDKKSGRTRDGKKKTPSKNDPKDPTEKKDPNNGNGDEEEQSEEDRAKRPTIRISIASGERISGKRVDFTVKATDYKGRNIPVFSEDDGSFTAVFNGQVLASTGSSGNETAFRVDMVDGSNEIYVEAVDREGNLNSKTVRFTADTSAEAKKTGLVYVSIEAQILHLGIIYDTEVFIHRGDTAKDVLEEAFSQAGITPVFEKGYLAGLKQTSISEGAWVDDETRAILEEMRKTEKDPEKQDRNSLKAHDFYDSSGWIYNVNGVFPEVGLGSYKMEDGDAIYLIFQLAENVY